MRMVITILAVLVTNAAAAAQNPAPPAPAAEWAAIPAAVAGKDVTVIAGGRDTRADRVLSADETRLVVLSIPADTLPAVKRALTDVAARNPRFLTDLTPGEYVVGDVHLVRGAVLHQTRRVSDLTDYVQTYSRNEVERITIRKRGGGFWGRLGAVGGYFVGALAGGYAGSLLCRCDAGFLPGMLTGGATGALTGAHAARREREVVVYARPDP